VVSASGPAHSGLEANKEVSTVEEFLERIGEEALHIVVHVVENIIENLGDNN
jgi:predicted house-cleaning noncanonical NTP pyrophosphatase (MazG superfamily)